jgi:hypothetical protein
VFVLGPFCSISHDSTLRRKGWTNPTIHSQVFVFVLARGGCGRGASALPLNASESSLTAREGSFFCVAQRSSGTASEFSTALG